MGYLLNKKKKKKERERERKEKYGEISAEVNNENHKTNSKHENYVSRYYEYTRNFSNHRKHRFRAKIITILVVATCNLPFVHVQCLTARRVVHFDNFSRLTKVNVGII